jgi:hypothetical protein
MQWDVTMEAGYTIQGSENVDNSDEATILQDMFHQKYNVPTGAGY